MPTLSRAGVRLFYEEDGSRSGPPLILHTGGAGSGAMWRDGGYVERLAEFRLILFDHRGRGRSDRPDARAGHAPGEYIGDVMALADELQLSAYEFFGYSFGGVVGYMLALADPRLRGLAVLGTVFDPPGEGAAPSDYAASVRQHGMAGLLDAIERGEGMSLPGWLRDDFGRTDPGQFALTLEAWAETPDPWQRLGEIEVPAALVAGELEDPDLVQDEMAAAMPDATSAHLRGAGHVGAFLRPDEVIGAVLPALRRGAGQTMLANRP
ncbi:MAG TPA: alpha/beta hydrolase [Gaiellales bacterium]|nr:alpha/beta hydrolase [Gaiellales bacterium]